MPHVIPMYDIIPAFFHSFLRVGIEYSMAILSYHRENAISYAKTWAFSRNPEYYDFNRLGGDCTNFASQCLFAGCKTMNFTPTFGWYYQSLNNRAPAWTGVEFFHRFLIDNANTPIGNGDGPFGKNVPINEIEIGDFIQLGRNTGEFYHTLLIVGFQNSVPLVAAHTNDAFNRPLTDYNYQQLRGIHIVGVRKQD